MLWRWRPAGLRRLAAQRLYRAIFQNCVRYLDKLGIEAVDGILLDLGVSSYQLDTPERGFSYAHDAPLDMRMTKTGLSARDVVNTYSFKALCRVFRDYGED